MMVLRRPGNGRWLLLATLLATAALVAAGAALAIAVVRYANAADYPGAARIASQDMFKVWPQLTVRRDSAYQTPDPFPAVYNWYSFSFKLGPEAYAISNCIQMARSFTDFYVVERQMSVMLCDTASGRMIWVMRSLSLRLR